MELTTEGRATPVSLCFDTCLTLPSSGATSVYADLTLVDVKGELWNEWTLRRHYGIKTIKVLRVESMYHELGLCA